MNVEHSLGVIRQALASATNPVIAFSGGKDSVVVAHLCRSLGIRKAVAEVSFFFQIQRDDVVAAAKSLDLDLEVRDSLNLEWLVAHPDFILPDPSRNDIYSRFYSLRQQKTVARYAKEQSHDAVFFGRRSQENCVRADTYLKDGRAQVFPIRSWRTEDVWDYIKANNLPVGRIYQTRLGIKDGNDPWNIYSAPKSRADRWLDLYAIDPATIKAAAKFIPEAAEAIR